MKISTGKTARAIRRREIFARLMELLDQLVEKIGAVNLETAEFRVSCARSIVIEVRQLLFELAEISAIDANQTTRPRIRKH